MKMFRAAVLTSVAALTFTCGATALAESGDSVLKSVEYADLNLTSDKGVKQLYKRLRFASRNVCSSYEGRELRLRRAWRNCYNQALAAAVSEVNIEQLTALHNRERDVRAS